MKKKLFTFAFLLFTTCLLSVSTFAQTGGAPGDDGTSGDDLIPVEGGGTISVPSTYTFKSYSFKRNNGNGWGVCGYNAQIRVEFSPMPPTAADIPKLTSIMYKGVNLLSNGYAKIINYQIVGQTQPYVSYCIQGIENLPGASDGNIAPAEKITLSFNGQ